MEPVGEEELDYEDEDYVQKKHFHTGGAISALAEEELLGEEDEYDDLYNDVNVGEDFIQSINNPQLAGTANGAEQGQDIGLEVEFPHREVNEAEIPGIGQEGKPSVKEDGVDYAEVEQQKSGGGGVKDLEEGADECAGSGSNPAVSISAPPPLKERRIEEVGLGKTDAKNGSLGHRGSGAVGLVKGAGDTGPASGKGGSPISGSGGGRGGAVLGSNRSGPNRSSLNENTGRHAGSNSHSGESGGTMLFVGELHWWTTDAELESVLSEYGRVKDVRFFDEKASGKCKGYCQVEFYDHEAAAACKEGMNGHVFNGRPCVVAYASPHTVRQMGAAQVNKSQALAQSQTQTQGQQRRMMNDGGGRGGGSSYQSGEGGRNYGKMGWGRGGVHGQGTGSRGPGGQGRGRGGMGGKNIGGGGGGGGGGPYGQGLPGPPMGGPPGGMMHTQGIMGQGFDPTYGAHMGRGGGYGGFSSHGPHFPGMIPSFPAVGTVGLPGVALHVNPAFFGRGMATNGMGVIPSGGMDGPQTGMWADPTTGGWGGEEHNRRMKEVSYVDDMGSEYGYSEISHERGGRSSAPRDKERGSDRDWAGTSERRRRDDREADWTRDRYREEKDGYMDQRQRERDWENEDDWEKEKPSRSRIKVRNMDQEDPRSRSKEADYGKRRRLPAELNE
eukprot:Gb_11742 [translate_table: standard]